VNLWNWIQTCLRQNKSIRSPGGCEEPAQPASECEEDSQPIAIKSEAEFYNESLATLREVATGQDVAEAIRLAEQLRSRFPHGAAGYRIGAKALRDSGRADEADALLRETIIRFPDEVWPLTESAWAALARGDWQEAIQHAEQIRERFPAHPAGYRVASPALRESKRLDEADELAIEGLARFPDEAWPLTERVLIAQSRGDWMAAIEQAEQLRERFPTHRAGYEVAAAALRAVKRFDDADALLRGAISRFPDEPWLLIDQAWSVRARNDRAEAIRLAEQLRTHFPDQRAGYRVAAMALREDGRLDEADAVLRDAAGRFQNEAWFTAERDALARLVGESTAAE
jgi:predicted Zn-dependent protease